MGRGNLRIEGAAQVLDIRQFCEKIHKPVDNRVSLGNRMGVVDILTKCAPTP
jgi:hypothetical protein